jgi:hypothetical protein
MIIEIEVSAEAAERWETLEAETQQELNMITNETILTMPVECVGSPTPCHSSEQNINATSKGGSTRTCTPPSLSSSVNVIALALICLSCYLPRVYAASLVDNRLLAAVSQIESNGQTTAKGDKSANGTYRAMGAFQFWRPTWDHVTSIRRKAGLQVTSYKDGATNLLWSREYARTYLQWCEDYLRAKGVHTPTRSQIYMVYNCGPGSAGKKGFRLSNAPATTQRAARKLEALCRK